MGKIVNFSDYKSKKQEKAEDRFKKLADPWLKGEVVSIDTKIILKGEELMEAIINLSKD